MSAIFNPPINRLRVADAADAVLKSGGCLEAPLGPQPVVGAFTVTATVPFRAPKSLVH